MGGGFGEEGGRLRVGVRKSGVGREVEGGAGGQAESFLGLLRVQAADTPGSCT